ncbi:hypothetical protein FOXB_17700 [Fusarium oxysporum f. sp. conglutinans Fo5176]|uniref:Uncharacterized protein n=1 Tax=Fusarium oxysporum (strain Fo5176) TaxID=660025 RepID=F9GGB6_FUSOF|nr:hypothetical protein FOXB_17700 [Fusarium oxysporum f. sp. conglutinans Fo5176]
MPQWEHAVQLFRTNSLDSLVRYFASYLPIDHIWHPLCQDSALAATHTFSTSPLPKKRCKRTKINKTFGAGGQTLLSSSMVLGRLPAKDQPLEADKLFDSTRPAVLSSCSEPGIKHTRPQEYSPYAGHGEAAVSSGDGLRTHSMRQHSSTRDYLPDYLSSRLILQATIQAAREAVVSIAK